MGVIGARLAALKDRSRYGARPLLWVALLVPPLLVGAFGWFDYRVESARAREHVAKTTDALAEHAEKVVETADLTLARVLDHVDALDWATIGSSRDVHEFLVQLKQQLPQMESVFLVSPTGINAASSRAFPLPQIGDSSREYFQRAAAGDRSLFISAPFRGQIAGTLAFTITRPRIKDGHFDGLAGVTVSQKYFEGFYRAVLEYPKRSSAALVRDDGTVLVRFPDAANTPALLPAFSTLMRSVASGQEAGVFTGVSGIDGTPRLAGFRRVQGRPLVVNYSLQRRVYLDVWLLNLALFALCAILLGSVLLFAERLLLRRAARERETLARLVEETVRRQEAEAALHQAQKMEALGQLTGGVAHDFNNLLAAILGSLELLERSVPEGRPARMLATARQAAQRGAQLTAQMLAFSRREEVRPEPLDVNEAIQATIEMLRRTVGATIRIRTELAGSLFPAMADPVQLEVALLNLAANARDAMPGGGDLVITTASVRAGQGEIPGLEPGEYVALAVSDTGEGMEDAVRDRALDPFFTTKGPGKGTGLGLSMVFGFAKLVRGTVTLRSSKGVGTTVTLYLPRATAEPRPETQPSPAPGVARAARRLRILLVDDDPGVRIAARSMLEELGHDVVEADDGPAALAIVGQDRGFELIIVDFAMPGMNGAELIEAVRNFWPEAHFLLLTGYVEEAWTALDMPTLRKPFTLAGLAAGLASALAPELPAAIGEA